MKDLLGKLNEANPSVKGNLLAALSNVRPEHLLDRKLIHALGAADAVEANPMMEPGVDSAGVPDTALGSAEAVEADPMMSSHLAEALEIDPMMKS